MQAIRSSVQAVPIYTLKRTGQSKICELISLSTSPNNAIRNQKKHSKVKEKNAAAHNTHPIMIQRHHTRHSTQTNTAEKIPTLMLQPLIIPTFIIQIPSSSTLVLLLRLAISEVKIQRHGNKQQEAKPRRPVLVVVPDGSPLRDLIHTPQIQPHTVQQCHNSDYSETPCRVQREAVSEVEKGSGDGTEVDGELEPG